ncbi:MAG: choice-of-anchor L domain-containing protein [Myxococcota bacterium]|nr:choice-of-anchor L domain-containing protein [Myxococcota bacterium]
MRFVSLAVLAITLTVVGCGPSEEPCERCGGDACVELQTDAVHCGACDSACQTGQLCTAGQCFTPECSAGATRACYRGAAGTQGVGRCQAGLNTCQANGTWGTACQGEVTPAASETCGNSVDDDCDGTGDPDLQTDVANCGSCGRACDADHVCTEGSCVPEVPPECADGETRGCYSGPQGTSGVGTCAAGTQTCQASGTWGSCEGEVLPTLDVCGNGQDEDCNGNPDDSLDVDGDGFTRCDGDCCDSAEDGCLQPTEVGPGAFEVLANGVDDNCDGATDTAPTACDVGLSTEANNPVDAAMALGLCQQTPGSGWGLVSAQWLKVDGTGSPAAEQRAARPQLGAVTAREGSALLVLSTAHAAGTADTNPVFSSFESTNNGTSSGFPSDWVLANGGTRPTAPGCAALGGTTALDPVMLRLSVKVPQNARSFQLSSYFLSAEFPEWTCSAYSDQFLVLLTSIFNGTPANPSDKNLATYTTPGNQRFPVGTNLATLDTGLFTACKNGPIGCSSSNPDSITTCTGSEDLVGTGLEGVTNVCETGDQVGGGTGWLTVRGNVVPGETITLRFALWDTGDANFDSMVLLDQFQWSTEPTTPGTSL